MVHTLSTTSEAKLFQPSQMICACHHPLNHHFPIHPTTAFTTSPLFTKALSRTHTHMLPHPNHTKSINVSSSMQKSLKILTPFLFHHFLACSTTLSAPFTVTPILFISHPFKRFLVLPEILQLCLSPFLICLLCQFTHLSLDFPASFCSPNHSHSFLPLLFNSLFSLNLCQLSLNLTGISEHATFLSGLTFTTCFTYVIPLFLKP